jgi:GNAT superfamily N-acetyltransferase
LCVGGPGSAGLRLPWRAGLFVEPGFRGHSYATALIRRVEAFRQGDSVPALWFYTSTAETLHVRFEVGPEDERDEEVVLMKRALSDGYRRTAT